MKIDDKEWNASLEENPTQTVAMVAVQAIGELSGVLDAAGAHDEATVALVLGVCAWLTSVLDGKDAAPGQALVDTAKAIDAAVLDELSRCQHYVAELSERTRKAESVAIVNEQYARWYLRLRDDITCKVSAGIHGFQFGETTFESLMEEQLDEAMEDDEAEDPGNDTDKPE